MSPLRLGLSAAALTLLLDQALKSFLLFGLALDERGPLALTPFVDLRLAWNTGISYSLFHDNGEAGRYALLALALIAIALLLVWLSRTRSLVTALALGLLIGGALGNAYDRLVRGAVADFFHVHFGGFSPWGVFNLADIAIVAGVAILLYEAVMTRQPAERRPPPRA